MLSKCDHQTNTSFGSEVRQGLVFRSRLSREQPELDFVGYQPGGVCQKFGVERRCGCWIQDRLGSHLSRCPEPCGCDTLGYLELTEDDRDIFERMHSVGSLIFCEGIICTGHDDDSVRSIRLDPDRCNAA